MQLNKISFALGNFFGAITVGLVVVACGGGGGGGAAVTSTDYGTIAASNILLNSGAQTAQYGSGVIRVAANQLPSNVQVMASNVSIVKTSNKLASTDLQTALDKEIAVDTSKSILGTWNIENITSDSTYTGAWATGKVTFNADGTYTISAGGFGAAGKVAAGTGSFCAIPTSQTYRLIDGAIYFGADAGGDSVASIAKNTLDSITLIGDGGCGAQGIARISKLTRVGAQQVAYTSPNFGKPKPIIPVNFRQY